MTDARLRLAEAISTAHGIRMGFEGTSLDRYVACDRFHWSQPHVLDPILAAARECVAGEVRAELDRMTVERAHMVLVAEAQRFLGDPRVHVSIPGGLGCSCPESAWAGCGVDICPKRTAVARYPGLDGEPCERFERAGEPG